MRRAYVLAAALIAGSNDAIKLGEPHSEEKVVEKSLDHLFDELGAS